MRQQEFPSPYKDHKNIQLQAGIDTSRLGFEFQACRQNVLDEKEYVLYQFTFWFLFFGVDLSYEVFVDVDGLIDKDRSLFGDMYPHEKTGFGD